MKTYLRITITALALLAAFQSALAKVNVITSTTDLAYFARVVGGEWVEVQSIAPATADLHFIEVRPSYMTKVSHADVVAKVGLELDPWMDRIVDGSHNDHVLTIDCSRYVQPLEVPTSKADARYGDLHRFGNPHYWLTPDNVAPITQALAEGLSQADPAHAEQFTSNRDAYLKELQAALPGLLEMARPLNGMPCITYHTSWVYFSAFTGLSIQGQVEPYPGVPPSPTHVAELIEQIKKADIRLILVEPYFDKRVPEKIASETNARVVTMYPSLGARRPDESYIDFLRGDIAALLGDKP